jgi:hypothetical protein
VDGGARCMKKSKYSAETAAREHMLEGNPLTRLEAMVMFGVISLPGLIRRMRNAGWIIESQRISYAAAIVRMREKAIVEPPTNLPICEIQLTDYWVGR